MKTRILVSALALVLVVSSAVVRFGRPYVSEKSQSDFSRSADGRVIKAHVRVTISKCEWPAFWKGCRSYVADARGVYIADATARTITGMLRLEETVGIMYQGQRQVILTCNSFTVSGLGLPDVASCKSFLGEEIDSMLPAMRQDFNTRELLGPELRRLQQQEEEQLRNDAPV